VVKVSCSDGRIATGFLWTNPDTAVTALHVVAGCGNVTVYYEGQRVSRSAKVEKVLRHADLALLRIADAPSGRVLVVDPVDPSLTEPLAALGYPLQIPSMTNTELHLRYGGKTLRAIVPDSVAQALSGGSPSLDLEIDFIEGHLLPGNSGAPIFNQRRKLVAIADGGLENGAAAVSWGIPAKFLMQLASSNESTNTPPAAGGTRSSHVLFAAEAEARNLGEETCSGLTLTRLRSVPFLQLAQSVDSPVGLQQLVQNFGVDPSLFQFDVYQHLPSGATFVVPHGSKLNQNASGDCTISAPAYHIEMLLQVAVMNSTSEVAAKGNAFELAWAGGSPKGWIIDPQWSNAAPVTRFDGLVVMRRAYKHIANVFTGFEDQYGFEAAAMRRNVFIGLSTKYTWTPQFRQQVMSCRMTPIMPQCRPVLEFSLAFAESVLAVQLTTFPVG
jgi:hypothetical protein